MTNHYSQKENLISIMKEISKKTPRGILNGDTQVGHITWQMYLLKDYLKLDGTSLANASNDYTDLLKFVQDNSLITSETEDNSLFKYDSTTDVLTLPNYIDLVLQGGNTVEEKEAGLPNIRGKFTVRPVNNDVDTVLADVSGCIQNDGKTDKAYGNLSLQFGNNFKADKYNLDASQSNKIYSDTVNTVQPPAITLIPQIKYRKSTTMWETVEIGKFVATAPAHYEREQLYTTNKTTITVYPTWVNINGGGYVLEGTKLIDIENADNWDDNQYVTAANRAGKDFYIYACEPTSNDAPDFILSANSTVPTGYTADNSRKIGGFHCLCLSVGTISGHTLSGYLTGDILPNSSWDLKHRAISENEGMVYIPEVNKWVDIYLTSYDGAKLVSEYNGAFVTGETTHKCHGEKFVEELGLVNKQLLTREEFMVIAKGSNENTTINGATNPVTTGGHKDSNNRRMVSNYGVEDCCGVLWQWLATTAENYPGATWSSANYYFSDYKLQDKSIYNSAIDSQKYGSCYGLVRRFISGGSWDDSSNCGSRCVVCGDFGSLVDANISSRGSSTMRNNI